MFLMGVLRWAFSCLLFEWDFLWDSTTVKTNCLSVCLSVCMYVCIIIIIKTFNLVTAETVHAVVTGGQSRTVPDSATEQAHIAQAASPTQPDAGLSLSIERQLQRHLSRH